MLEPEGSTLSGAARGRGPPNQIVAVLALWMSGKRNPPEVGIAEPGSPGGTVGPLASSGDDIGRDLVFDERDAIAQLQFAFLQSLQPQQIRRGRLMQRVDRRIEIAMLLLQPGELVFELALIIVGHGVR